MNECPKCDRSFETMQGLGQHHSATHGEKLSKQTTCENCGDEFDVELSDKYVRFCSKDCFYKSRQKRKDKECAKCHRTFELREGRSDEYCCRSCWLEGRHDRPRPDNPESLLWLLYHYEGFSIDETFRRQRAVLGFENRLYKDDVRQKLREMGLTRRYTSWSLQKADPDTVGGAKPEGSDEWKRHYQSA